MPPPVLAELSLRVQSMTVSIPLLSIPPPAVLPVRVESMRVSVPKL
jgi:hypothetical protein